MRSLLFGILALGVGCAEPPREPRRSDAPATDASNAAVAPPPPRAGKLEPAWSVPCDTCSLTTLDVARDGSVFVAGSSHRAFTLGGKRHPARAYEQAILARIDGMTGGLVWSRPLGVEWHNKIDSLLVDGDGVTVSGIHGNGFDAGGTTLPRLEPKRRLPGQDLGFEAETGFIAHYASTGELRWVENASKLVSREHRAGMWVEQVFGSPSLYPGPEGVWLTTRDEGSSATTLVRDGQAVAVLSHDVVDSSVYVAGDSLAVARDGARYQLRRRLQSSYDLVVEKRSARGETTTLPVFSLVAPGSTEAVNDGPTISYGFLRLTPEEDVFAVALAERYSNAASPVAVWARAAKVGSDGARVVELFQAIRPQGDDVSIRATAVDERGRVVVAVHHSVPLVVAGVTIDARALPGEAVPRAGSLSLLTLAPDGTHVQRIETFMPDACSPYVFRRASALRVASDTVHVLATGRTNDEAASCGIAPAASVVVKLSRTP